ncbi:MAG TPA: Rrf2 family transcriptional regulator [Planctomycetes bacterium]|nr:Rrf2 family transcriptional regulator [Planctomycetota bacterium]
MQNIFSQGCQYALRALQVMSRSPRRAMTVFDLCRTARIPEHFTRKMLQPLVRKGILRSTRGPGGGFSFARNPASVNLLEMVEVIDKGFSNSRCALGDPECDDDRCPLDAEWRRIEDHCRRMLSERTIANLAQGASVEAPTVVLTRN